MRLIFVHFIKGLVVSCLNADVDAVELHVPEIFQFLHRLRCYVCNHLILLHESTKNNRDMIYPQLHFTGQVWRPPYEANSHYVCHTGEHSERHHVRKVFPKQKCHIHQSVVTQRERICTGEIDSPGTGLPLTDDFQVFLHLRQR